MSLDASNYLDLIILYVESGYNAREALRVYRERFPPPHPTNPRVILNAMYRIRDNRPVVPRTSVDDQRGGRSRAIPARVEDRILQYFDRNPRSSSRQVGRLFGVSHMTVLKIMKLNRRRPFRVQKVQALLPRDLPVRAAYCRWMLDNITRNEHFVEQIMWTDESTFTRNGMWNRQNERIWARENPHAHRHTAHQQRWSVNVWGAIHGENLIGPVFLPPTLNRHGFLHLLNTDVADYLSHLSPDDRRTVWFQMDGAPSHSVSEVRDCLNSLFGSQWIGRYGPHRWPARSPDLTEMDFFLWGTIKDRVYADVCETREEMMQRIVLAFDHLRQKNGETGMFSRVHRQTIERMRVCLQREGGHIEHRL